jgi:glycosyltransferase involved in cell wall biosynthesis
MTRQLVSIVIRCCNEQEHIGRLLTGIFKQSISDVEVIVIDSGSTDQTISIASRFPVYIHEIRPNDFSFGSAINLGCSVANGDFMVLASAHVYPVYKDWLERLITPFSSSKIALVYGKQRGSETTKYSEHKIFKKWFPDESNFLQDHPFCNNANAAIRRSLWKKLPYDETLTGLEDIDWAKRVMQLGYKIVYEADAEVVHIHNESERHILNRYRREAIALKRIFPQERFSLWDFLRLYIGNTVSDYCHAWHDKVLRRNLKSISAFRLMQFWGTYCGYLQRGIVSRQLRQTFYYPNGWSRSGSETTRVKQNDRIEYVVTQEEGHVGTLH